MSSPPPSPPPPSPPTTSFEANYNHQSNSNNNFPTSLNMVPKALINTIISPTPSPPPTPPSSPPSSGNSIKNNNMKVNNNCNSDTSNCNNNKIETGLQNTNKKLISNINNLNTNKANIQPVINNNNNNNNKSIINKTSSKPNIKKAPKKDIFNSLLEKMENTNKIRSAISLVPTITPLATKMLALEVKLQEEILLFYNNPLLHELYLDPMEKPEREIAHSVASEWSDLVSISHGEYEERHVRLKNRRSLNI
jgi:hypothetical protein